MSLNTDSNPLQEQIRSALTPLIGLPLWDAVRALNMEMFQFGAKRSRVNRRGEEVEVGEFALHIQCPWRITGPTGIIVGSDDRFYPMDDSLDWDSFDPANDTSRLESRVTMWLGEHEATSLRVANIESDDLGGFELTLQSSFVLPVFPTQSEGDEHSEYWRLLKPSDQQAHFVVSSRGVGD